MRKINCLIKQKKRGGATTASTGAAGNFGFFSVLVGFFSCFCHISTNMGITTRSSSSYGHTAPRYYSSYSCTSGAMCPFPHWVRYFPRSMIFHHLTSLCLHLCLILFTELIPLVILVGIAILTHQVALTHLIPLHLVPLLISPTVVVFVLIVLKNI